MIISAFPGAGKTTLKELYSNVVDLESSEYKYVFNPNATRQEIEARKHEPRGLNFSYPHNYLQKIIQCNKEYDFVLTSCGNLITSAMEEEGLNFFVVQPKIECKDEYIQRYINRGNNSKFITYISENFEKFIEKNTRKYEPQNRIIWLEKGEYLSDKMEEFIKIKKQLECEDNI